MSEDPAAAVPADIAAAEEPPAIPTVVPAEEPAETWSSVLDELEEQVGATEEMLADARAEEIAAWGRRSSDWVPPSSLGPLPDELRERAARLLQHQLAVAERLVERITQSKRQRDVAARMSYGPDRAVPSFIDQAL
jgi:hypothetical protein